MAKVHIFNYLTKNFAIIASFTVFLVVFFHYSPLSPTLSQKVILSLHSILHFIILFIHFAYETL